MHGMQPIDNTSSSPELPVRVVVMCEATAEHLDAVHEGLARFWEELDPPQSDEWRMLFELAVSEVAANIVEHARPRYLTLKLSVESGQAIAEFWDRGLGWAGPPEPGQLLDELAERGRGLTLAINACDEVTYERVGPTNHWRLIKSL